MRKYIFIGFLLVSLSGCQTLRQSLNDLKAMTYKAVSPLKSSSKKVKRKNYRPVGYLAKGYPEEAASQSVREEKKMPVPSETKAETSSVQLKKLENSSKPELIEMIIELDEQFKETQITKNRALDELSGIKVTFQKQLFELDNDLEKEKKKNQELQDQLIQAELNSLKMRQKLDEIRMNIIEKREMFQSKFPIYYEVVKGDSLWKIAGKSDIYHNPYKWTEIFWANRDKIQDKDYIYPGTVLLIPRYHDLLLSEFGREVKDGMVALEKKVMEAETQ